MPRKALMVPRVTMKGGNLSRVMRVPLRKPEAVPAIMPMSVPSHIPGVDSESPPLLSMVHAPAMPATASIEPTERSMPPEMMIAVIPTPIMALTLERRRTFEKLSTVRNWAGPWRVRSWMERAMMIKRRLAKGRSWRSSLFMGGLENERVNPEGIPTQSPGLRGTSYPGSTAFGQANPERVAANGDGSNEEGRNPLGVVNRN